MEGVVLVSLDRRYERLGLQMAFVVKKGQKAHVLHEDASLCGIDKPDDVFLIGPARPVSRRIALCATCTKIMEEEE